MGMRPGAPGQMPLAASGMTMGARPMMPGQISATMPGLRPPVGSNVDMQGGPPAKKMKPEETLIPEQTFLRQNPPTGRLTICLVYLASYYGFKAFWAKDSTLTTILSIVKSLVPSVCTQGRER